MLKRRQVLTMVSIAVVSFLIGTMFNVNFMVIGSDGTDDYGVPFDKIWTAIYELQSKIDSLNASLVELEARVSEQGFINAPAYDSGWVSISLGETVTLEHGLGTTDVFVWLVGKYDVDGTIHQWMYGGGFDDNQGAVWFGLTSTQIKITRFINDIRRPEGQWNQIRVRIWRISEPPT